MSRTVVDDFKVIFPLAQQHPILFQQVYNLFQDNGGLSICLCLNIRQ